MSRLTHELSDLQDRVAATVAAAECIDRAIMPQIDDEHLTEFIDYLRGRGVGARYVAMRPKMLRGFQRINRWKVRGMARAKAYDKPILISRDDIIVDGNHRAAAARAAGSSLIGALMIDADFVDIFGLVCEFPKTYEVE